MHNRTLTMGCVTGEVFIYFSRHAKPARCAPAETSDQMTGEINSAKSCTACVSVSVRMCDAHRCLQCRYPAREGGKRRLYSGGIISGLAAATVRVCGYGLNLLIAALTRASWQNVRSNTRSPWRAGAGGNRMNSPHMKWPPERPLAVRFPGAQ